VDGRDDRGESVILQNYIGSIACKLSSTIPHRDANIDFFNAGATLNLGRCTTLVRCHAKFAEK
jgi:hypothetical protein